ncbi:MAG: glucosylceramidase [Clostridia bacterium]|nr:glucosylceramidase [Clostridia bacterium]
MKQFTTLYRQGKKALAEKDCHAEESSRGQEKDLINLYPEIMYQRIEGFGGAFTDAAGYVYSLMPENLRRQLIRDYFSREGLGYTWGRTSVDSCDFSRETYESDSDPEDTDLKHFDVSRAARYVLPLLLDAQKEAGAPIRLMFTPWSPPAWMETNGSRLHGGQLKPENYDRWAAYISRYLTEFSRLGAHPAFLSPQNEPKASQTWDSCLFSVEEERLFIRDSLYPALAKQHLDHIGLLIWDHNKERAFDRACHILSDPETAKKVAGVAVHWYSGDHFEALQMIRDAFPEKTIVFSEACVEYSIHPGQNQLRNARMYAHEIIGDLNHGMSLFLDWNLLLDERGGPNHVGNYCDAPVMYDTKTGELRKNLSFDYIGHFSRFIQPGARRIGMSRFGDCIEVTAAQNPDGSVCAVVMNPGAETLSFSLRMKDRVWPVILEGDSISTFVFSSDEIK